MGLNPLRRLTKEFAALRAIHGPLPIPRLQVTSIEGQLPRSSGTASIHEED
jgi:hypothetical protein